MKSKSWATAIGKNIREIKACIYRKCYKYFVPAEIQDWRSVFNKAKATGKKQTQNPTKSTEMECCSLYL